MEDSETEPEINEELIPDINTSKIVFTTKNYGNKRITTNLLRKNEFVQVVMTRADQINKNNKTYNERKAIDSITIAIIEIIEKKCPLSIIRNITDTEVDIWDINEMALTPNCINDINYFLSTEEPNLKKKLSEFLK